MIKQIVGKYLILILLFILIGLSIYFRETLNLKNIIILINSYGIWGPIVFIFVYYFSVILFFPASILTIAGGLLFGPVWGLIFNIVASNFGALSAFLISRYVASDLIAKRSKGILKTLMDGIDREGWRFVAVVRLVPLFPFNLLNYALGLTRIKVWEYFITSFVFMLPGTIAYTYLGSLGEDIIKGDVEKLVSKIFIVFGLFVLVLYIGWKIKKQKNIS